jgi:hypothetical protein
LHYLFTAVESVVDVDDIVRKLVIALRHKPDKNMQVMYAIEDENFLCSKPVFIFQEFTGDLGIMERRPEMMDCMVTIVPADFIVFCIDAINSVLFWIMRIYERMLCPVAKHHHYPCKHERDNEYP